MAKPNPYRVVSTNGLVQKLANGAVINWADIVPGSSVDSLFMKLGYTRPAGAAPPGSAMALAKNPPAAPFLTGDQIIARAQAQQAHDSGYQTIADNLAQLGINNQYQKIALERSRVQGVAGAQDNAAARGIFNSSIKDGQVYDIDAQAATAQQHLLDNMAAAQASATANRAILDTALNTALTGFNQNAVANASQIDTGYNTNYGQQPPTPTPIGVARGGPPASKPKPQPEQMPTVIGGQPQKPSGAYFHVPGLGWVTRPQPDAAP